MNIQPEETFSEIMASIFVKASQVLDFNAQITPSQAAPATISLFIKNSEEELTELVSTSLYESTSPQSASVTYKTKVDADTLFQLVYVYTGEVEKGPAQVCIIPIRHM